MPKPSLVDYLIGNPLVMLAEFGLLYLCWQQYQSGQEDRIVFLFIGGFMVLWSNAARLRVAAYRAHRREWQAMEARPGPRSVAQPAPRRAKRRLPGPVRAVLNTVKWIVILPVAIVAILFLWSFASAARQAWFGNPLPDLIGAIIPWLATPPWLMPAIDWSEAHPWPAAAALAAVILALGLCVRAMLTSLLRRRQGGARAEAQAPWDGTVQVVIKQPRR